MGGPSRELVGGFRGHGGSGEESGDQRSRQGPQGGNREASRVHGRIRVAGKVCVGIEGLGSGLGLWGGLVEFRRLTKCREEMVGSLPPPPET